MDTLVLLKNLNGDIAKELLKQIEKMSEDHQSIISFFLSSEDSMNKIGLELAKNSNLKPCEIIKAILNDGNNWKVYDASYNMNTEYTKEILGIRITIRAGTSGVVCFDHNDLKIQKLNKKGLIVENLMYQMLRPSEFINREARYSYLFIQIYKKLA